MCPLQVTEWEVGKSSGHQLSDAEAAAIQSTFTMHVMKVKAFVDEHDLYRAPPLGTHPAHTLYYYNPDRIQTQIIQRIVVRRLQVSVSPKLVILASSLSNSRHSQY